MPELPEVEEVRRTLEPFILGRSIASVSARRADFLTPRRAPVAALAGGIFKATHRHGKKLFVELADSRTLLFHLGMSGRIDCVPADAPMEKHTHFILHLDNGRDVRFRDPRRFGGVWYFSSLADALAREVAGQMGPDALTCEPGHFAHWKKSRGLLKVRLLSQKDLAGLGNIYVDEALWESQLHPLQRVERISPTQIERLTQAILDVLNRSLRSGGTTLRDYRNVSNQPGNFARQLKAYGRGGEPCLRCKTPLETITAAGRTTVYCKKCQKRH